MMAIDHDTAMHDAVGEVARTGHQGTRVPVDGQTTQGDGAIDGTALSEEWGVEYPLTQAFLHENAKTTAQNSKAIELLLQKVVSAPSGSASSPASLADVKSLIHRPSLFSGEQTEKEEVRSWLKTLERAVGGIITDSRAKADYMGGCLRGRAQVLYESLIEQQKPSFEELSEFLIKYFGEKNVEHHARQKLMSLCMKEGDLTGYTSDFMRYYSMCIANPVDPADAIEFYHRGLTVELQSALRMDPATKKWWSDLSTLIDSATLEYSVHEGKAAKSKAASVAAVQSADGVQMSKLKAANGGGGGKRRRNRKGKGKGSGNGSKGTASGNGQASGNGSKRSSKPLECYTCGGPHMARECPKRFRADQASAPYSADEPSTSGRGHLEQSFACHVVGAEMISELRISRGVHSPVCMRQGGSMY